MAGKAVVDFDFSATLSTSDWLGILKQTLGSKIVAGEGGASLPQAPAESLLNAADKQLYFIGSVGKSALGQVPVKAVAPEKAGAVLYACDQLWKEVISAVVQDVSVWARAKKFAS